MKPESNDLNLRSGRNPCLKISKILRSNWGEMMKIRIPKFLIPKSNINYINGKD